MPRIPFVIRTIPFVTERGIAVPARRPFLLAQFVGPAGQGVPYPAFLDTGSPYSVIPCRPACQVPWKDLGAQVIAAGMTRAVEWNGIPCIGHIALDFLDVAGNNRTHLPSCHLLAT
jgi:hypothetical protein